MRVFCFFIFSLTLPCFFFYAQIVPPALADCSDELDLPSFTLDERDEAIFSKGERLDEPMRAVMHDGSIVNCHYAVFFSADAPDGMLVDEEAMLEISDSAIYAENLQGNEIPIILGREPRRSANGLWLLPFDFPENTEGDAISITS